MQIMKKVILIIFTILLNIHFSYSQSNMENKEEYMEKIYDFTMTDIDGNDVQLSDYQGKVIMLVNVASKCGFTSQYKELQEIYIKYMRKGFVILAFPANNFLKQEPGTDAEIKSFCSLNYGVTFPIFSKISVKGKDIDPLYKFLTQKSPKEFCGKIGWNFTKFLINKDGIVVNRFNSKTKPNKPKVIKSIEVELSK